MQNSECRYINIQILICKYVKITWGLKLGNWSNAKLPKSLSKLCELKYLKKHSMFSIQGNGFHFSDFLSWLWKDINHPSHTWFTYENAWLSTNLVGTCSSFSLFSQNREGCTLTHLWLINLNLTCNNTCLTLHLIICYLPPPYEFLAKCTEAT